MKKILVVLIGLLLVSSPLYSQRIESATKWTKLYSVDDTVNSIRFTQYVSESSIVKNDSYRKALFKSVYTRIKTGIMLRETGILNIFDCSDSTATVAKAIDVDSTQFVMESMEINVAERLQWQKVKQETLNGLKFRYLCK